jgi:beta-carotene hydroxylase
MILKNKNDKLTFWIIFAGIACSTIPFIFDRLPLIGYFFFFIINTLLISTAGGAAHAHGHQPIFHSDFFSNIFTTFLGILRGTPNHTGIIIHNVHHHGHLEVKEKDWTGTWILPKNRSFFTLFQYPYLQYKNIKAHLNDKYLNTHYSPKFVYEYKRDKRYILIFNIIFFLLSPYKFIFLIFIPRAISLFYLMNFNLLHHDNCEDSEYKHSRNYTGKIINFVSFNSGYQTVHHNHPEIHWSELPALHKRNFSG